MSLLNLNKGKLFNSTAVIYVCNSEPSSEQKRTKDLGQNWYLGISCGAIFHEYKVVKVSPGGS